MLATGVIIAILVIIFVAIHFRHRTDLREAKKDLVSCAKLYYGKNEGEVWTFDKALSQMKEGLRKDISLEQKRVFKDCLDGYKRARYWLHFSDVALILMILAVITLRIIGSASM